MSSTESDRLSRNKISSGAKISARPAKILAHNDLNPKATQAPSPTHPPAAPASARLRSALRDAPPDARTSPDARCPHPPPQRPCRRPIHPAAPVSTRLRSTAGRPSRCPSPASTPRDADTSPAARRSSRCPPPASTAPTLGRQCTPPIHHVTPSGPASVRPPHPG
ncbi:hypothetical protein BDA96_05G102800 [Sorghum bicolor]|uniref:Uncharacterized protein n=1 Tax=Sorghum bicolor TaxID=4558 RepID=A0A921QXD7_SORBI|nr:hypothetical protein BDA96_05G102800 [Sorghum bicolor]